jgi:uncharacterized protein
MVPDVHLVVAFLAGVAGGAINALAGGGTNLTFPALVWFGLPPVQANATSAVALWPGSLSGAWGFHHLIERAPRWWLWLLLPSAIGGGFGAWLLIHTPPTFFRSLAPWLVLASTLLVTVEPAMRRWLGGDDERRHSTISRGIAIAVQAIVSVYGGYFGAGLGILMLTALAFLGVRDIRQANGLKNLFSAAVKGVAVLYFVIVGEVVWTPAVAVGAGSILGGYGAARLGQSLSDSWMRWIVAATGIAIAGVMFAKLA